MPYIGNDIVDLQDSGNKKKSVDLRYLKKTLTDEEIEIVHLSQNPDRALWSFWACKEAAHKVLKKSHHVDSFIPRRWSVRIRLPSAKHPASLGSESNILPRSIMGSYHQPHEGYVIIPEREAVYVYLFPHLSYVHCVASDSLAALDSSIWGVNILSGKKDKQNNGSSSQARKRLARRLAAFLHISQNVIKIRRIKNGTELQPPIVSIGGMRSEIDLSLSHDGRFISYAFICGNGISRRSKTMNESEKQP